METIYLQQLDAGIKIYRWRLTNFLISVSPFILVLVFQTIGVFVFSVAVMGVLLILNIELAPNVSVWTILKNKMIYTFGKKKIRQEQTYSLKKLREIENRIRFETIESNHIVINDKRKGYFFEWVPYNLNLMSNQEKDGIILRMSSFFSNFDNFKIIIEEQAQNFKNQIKFNEDLNLENKVLKELVHLRTDYFRSLEAGELEEEKITVLYFESSRNDDEPDLQIRQFLGIAQSNDIHLRLLEEDTLKRFIAANVSDTKLIEILPDNSFDVLSQSRKEDKI